MMLVPRASTTKEIAKNQKTFNELNSGLQIDKAKAKFDDSREVANIQKNIKAEVAKAFEKRIQKHQGIFNDKIK